MDNFILKKKNKPLIRPFVFFYSQRFTGRSRSRSITPVHWRRAANENRFRPNYQKQVSNHLQLSAVEKAAAAAAASVKQSESKRVDVKENGEKKDRHREREWDRDRERDINNKSRDRKRSSRERQEKGELKEFLKRQPNKKCKFSEL